MAGFVKLPQACSSDPEIDIHSVRRPPIRPKFHHKYTNDRIREGSGTPPTFSMFTKIKKDRKSVFKELGLDDDEPSPRYTSEHELGYITGLSLPAAAAGTKHRSPRTRRVAVDTSDSDGDGDDRRSETEKPRADQREEQQSESESTRSPTTPSSSSKPWYAKLTPGRRPRIKTVASAPPSTMSSRLSTTALLIAVVLPAFSYYNGRAQVSLSGADAGVIRSAATAGSPIPALETRADSPTDVCARWAHQAAQLNGTLYIYGGQAKRTKDQTTDTWNNYFLTLDLTKSWDVSSPSLKGLPQPSGPPKVAMGYLWNDYNNLFLYGGQFADNPFVEPASPISVWRYSIPSQTWTEFKSPKTSKGNNSDPGDTYIQRSAEGAGLSVPELGMSWYFGGHLDWSTTPGWSNQIERVYLKSLLEFTHPRYTNDGVSSLAGGTGAGETGVYRNITQGGLQKDDDGSKFPERADGVLVFVPGWGEKGVLIGLAGGTNETFTDDLSVLDVYDIARSEWYHQETRGDPPSVRVNPCAVIASAPDASSFQIYVYGGQNLLPFGEQIQYSDMYILSIPSFTWIKVPSPHSGSPIPSPRAGHTCHLRDGQIIILGGYTSPTTSSTATQECDSPGIYIFDASTLRWSSKFSSLGDEHPPDLNPENSVLAGSYGYRVPSIVANVIGGDENGGATATQPAAGPATGGPFATGKSPAFTITRAGSTATITRWGPGASSTSTSAPGSPGSTGGDTGGGNGTSEKKKTGGLIAAGVIAGLAGLAAAYLGYCAWIYRRQVRAYRSHLAVANRYHPSASTSQGGLAGWFLFGRKGSKGSSKESRPSTRGSSLRGSKGKRTGDVADGRGLGEKRRIHLRDESRSTASGGDYEDGYKRNSWVGGGGVPVPTEPRFMFDDLDAAIGRPSLGGEKNSGGTGTGTGSGSASGVGSGRLSVGSRPPPVVGSWWADSSAGGSHGSGGTGTRTGTGTGSGSGIGSGARSPANFPPSVGITGDREKMSGAGEVHFAEGVEDSGVGKRRRISGESESSTEALLDGQEPSFFSVVLGPRRALRVVNGLEGLESGYSHDEETDHDRTEGDTDDEGSVRGDQGGARYSDDGPGQGRGVKSSGWLHV